MIFVFMCSSITHRLLLLDTHGKGNLCSLGVRSTKPRVHLDTVNFLKKKIPRPNGFSLLRNAHVFRTLYTPLCIHMKCRRIMNIVISDKIEFMFDHFWKQCESQYESTVFDV